MRTIGFLFVFVAFTVLCLLPAGAQSTPDVTNVTAYQDEARGRNVRITYDLAITGGGTADVWLAISDDGGLNYSIAPKALSGDVGAGITAGNGKHIIWNAMADLPNVHGTNFRAKVTAWSPDCEGLTITLPSGVPLELVCIPAGSSIMGSSDPGWSWPNEEPVHQVTIGYDFYMGKYEITQAQWVALMGNNPSHITGDTHPVSRLSWNDCQQFITALNQLGQGTFRLPSEAEWEYACRAGTTTRFYFGDSDCDPSNLMPYEENSCELDAYAWFIGNINFPGGGLTPTKPVGGRLPNAFGLFDMHGNVWEWCEDDSHDDYTGAPIDGSPWVDSPRGEFRVNRSGSTAFWPRDCRSAFRNWNSPDVRHSGNGLRIVRDK